MGARRRLDAELVRRGLAANRSEARRCVEAGEVLVGGAPATKPARLVSPAEPILLTGDPQRFVSRAGEKLDAALEEFGVEVTGRRAVDVGASTGGFTDCLLQRGAAGVVAVDVGHGQLHEKLRADRRVRVLERVNVRDLAPDVTDPDDRVELVGPPASLVVADVSFISLRTIRDAVMALAEPGGDLILLVKPQFEAGRREAARGSGVITDPEVRARTLQEVTEAYEEAGAEALASSESSVAGARGNVEYLLHLRKLLAGDRS